VNAADPTRTPGEVSIARGNVYLSREICETYLPGVLSVALMVREEEVMIVPLIGQSAGGLLLKQRNARGDRVIHAQEFFRSRNLPEEFEARSVPVRWSREAAALVIGGLLVDVRVRMGVPSRPAETDPRSHTPGRRSPGAR
jgi:hypothetical protein